jgi:hypothetical protein
MRTLTTIILIIALVTLSSCKQNTDPKAVLENTETRSELFTAITDNHEYMTAFMEIMSHSDHAMQMMQENSSMMSTMMHGNGMQMMMGDSTMMHSMMTKMMQNGQMMGQMINMMHQEGMMSTECLNACMKKMSEKGMDMSAMGTMGTMKGAEITNHTTH